MKKAAKSKFNLLIFKEIVTDHEIHILCNKKGGPIQKFKKGDFQSIICLFLPKYIKQQRSSNPWNPPPGFTTEYRQN